MTKITLDDIEYDTDNFNEDQIKITNTLNLGMNTSSLLNHMLQSVQAIQQMKTTELKKSLDSSNDTQTELNL
tara:strand:- start:707 stop:922 length:216 start_codon:yes stop_codon:yes gene_type:complete